MTAPETKSCERCNVTIVRKRARGHSGRNWDRRRWCSKECRYPQRPHDSKVCVSCGQTFYRGKTRPSAWVRRTLCDAQCPKREGDYRVEEALWLLGGGEWPPRIAERLGTTCRALSDLLFRRGHTREALKFQALAEEVEAA